MLHTTLRKENPQLKLSFCFTNENVKPDQRKKQYDTADDLNLILIYQSPFDPEREFLLQLKSESFPVGGSSSFSVSDDSVITSMRGEILLLRTVVQRLRLAESYLVRLEKLTHEILSAKTQEQPKPLLKLIKLDTATLPSINGFWNWGKIVFNTSPAIYTHTNATTVTINEDGYYRVSARLSYTTSANASYSALYIVGKAVATFFF